MNLLLNRVAYCLIVLSLVACVSLQAAWIYQFYKEGILNAKKDIEQCVNDAAKKNIYKYLIANKPTGSAFKSFFLSSEWMEFNKSFDNLNFSGLTKKCDLQITGDSTDLQINFLFNNQFQGVKNHTHSSTRTLPIHAQFIDSISQISMNLSVINELKSKNINLPTAFAIYDYSKNRLITKNKLVTIRNAAFVSKKYTYNLFHWHKYQLIIPELNSLVLYQIRFYLLASLIMLMLTGLAFYFIIRLMRQQRVYAQARIAFTDNMTHELKTPVATIALALESITKYNLINNPEKLTDYLNISRQELSRLNLLIEKVLNLNENDERQKLHMELVDVQVVLQNAINTLQLKLSETRAKILYMPSTDLCIIYGDHIHIHNVFLNLIDNAVKYGGPDVKLEITCYLNKNSVQISFKDNGPGIANIYQKQIFERFFRVKGLGDTHNVKGFGLGLHYVKEMVEAHEGTITLKSELGEGSTFLIIFKVINER